MKSLEKLKLSIPKEPKNIQREVKGIVALAEREFGNEMSNFGAWHGNRLQKYLWDEWKQELKSIGFTWQIFLKLLALRTDSALMWYREEKDWKDFIKDTKELIKSPLADKFINK
ncbi:MAG: hypothetical protein WD607_01975 [Candidatus Paceibacterota bacterium]